MPPNDLLDLAIEADKAPTSSGTPETNVTQWLPAKRSAPSPPYRQTVRSLPLEMRSSVAVMRAATLGDCRPGRTATR